MTCAGQVASRFPEWAFCRIRFALDPSRTFADFGAVEFTPLVETVRQGIMYYQQHGTLGEYTHLKIDRDQA